MYKLEMWSGVAEEWHELPAEYDTIDEASAAAQFKREWGYDVRIRKVDVPYLDDGAGFDDDLPAEIFPRRLWGLVLGAAMFALLSLLAWAVFGIGSAAAAPGRECFTTPRMYEQGGPTGPYDFAVDAPNGATVTVTAWDEYPGRESVAQSSERAVVELDNGVLAVTDDLDDNVVRAETALIFDTIVPFSGVSVRHRGDGTSPNSLQVQVCVDPAPMPVPTSTTAPIPAEPTPAPAPPAPRAVELLPPAQVAPVITEQPTFTG